MILLSSGRYVLALQDLGLSASVARFDGWAFLRRDAPPASALGDHSCFAVDAEVLHAELAARGVPMVKPLSDEAWGMREFGVVTPELGAP